MKVRIPVSLTIDNNPVSGLRVTNSLSNSYLKSEILDNELILSILEYSAEWVEIDKIIQKLEKYNHTYEYLKNIINLMLERHLLIDEYNSEYKIIESSYSIWKNYNWDIPFKYHLHTNKLNKIDYLSKEGYIADQKKMEENNSKSKKPNNYKEYINSEVIELERKIENNYNISSIFSDDVGLDKHKDKITLQEFGKLLYFSFGQVGVKKDSITGEHIAKTSPSGGARHPLETYVFVVDIEGLSPGLYHYSVKNHTLELINNKDLKTFIINNIICGDTKLNFNMKACFVHTLIFERSMHRYREPRSYRAVNYDIGHIMQTTALVCSSMGINSYRGYSMNDDIVEKAININGIEESACTYTVIG